MIEIRSIPPIPPREPDAHKGRFGHVLVLAGSPRMTGAALLTTMGALRSGAGLVTLGLPARIQSLIAPAILEAMVLPLPCTEEGAFSREAIQPALDFSANASAAALGPGITTGDDTVAFTARVAQRFPAPLVIDADGLNCLAKAPSVLRVASAPRVMTPHPGEAARLLGRTTAQVQADRQASAVELTRRFGSVVVLKGHESLVTDGDRSFVNPSGNPGMATGGAGDVLTGIIAGLLGQGMDAFEASVVGVHAHGLAGDLAAKKVGQNALIARDLLENLGSAFLSL